MNSHPSQGAGPALWGAVPYHRPVLNPSLQAVFAQLPPTYLHEVQNAALQDRIDTKYLLTETQALTIFGSLIDHYKVLEVEGFRGGHYRTLYFDTPMLDMYMAHHAGVRARYKVRMRSYVDSRLTFLEVKRKSNRNRTVKTRIPAEAALSIADQGAAFLGTQCPYNAADLVPRIYNEFIRVTLVGMQHLERLTLDFALTIGVDNTQIDLPGLVVVEVKQKKRSVRAGIFRQLHDLHLASISFSKYVFATTLLTAGVKQNRFKERHMHVADVLRACEAINSPVY